MQIFTPGLLGSNGTGHNFEVPDGAFVGWQTLDANLSVTSLSIVRTLGAPIHPRPGGMPMNDSTPAALFSVLIDHVSSCVDAAGLPQFLPEAESLLEALRRDRYDSPPWNDTSHETFRFGAESESA